MRPFVELEDVDFAYGAVSVLERINLTVEAGDFLGIIGPNGSGKTTLLRIVLGPAPADPRHGPPLRPPAGVLPPVGAPRATCPRRPRSIPRCR